MTDDALPPESEALWARAAQELARNPDSPASLRILSAFNHALRPHEKASQQLTQALADRLATPGAQADAAVAAAVASWERTTGGTIDAELLALFEDDARKVHDARRRAPPPLEQILGEKPRPDYGYMLAGSLQGLQGTWHRLWAALVLEGCMGGGDDLSAQLRAEFERQLGRPMSPAQWSALTEHARNRVSDLESAQGRDPTSP